MRCRSIQPIRNSCVRQTLRTALLPAPVALYDGPLLALRERISGLLARLPDTDPQALHALGDSLGRAGDGTLETFTDAVRQWLGERVARGGDAAKLAKPNWLKLRRPGTSSINPPPTWILIIPNESRWFSPPSVCLRRPRAIDTK